VRASSCEPACRRGAERHLKPGRQLVWHVVGLQQSVREWAIRQGWGGRPVRQEQGEVLRGRWISDISAKVVSAKTVAPARRWNWPRERVGTGRTPARQEQAQGILIAALGMLVAHFG
jgi:hypothetical protein